MSQKMFKKASIVLSGLMLSGTVFSAPQDKSAIVKECLTLGRNLTQLAKTNKKENEECRMNVGFSGMLMNEVALETHKNQFEPALKSLNLANTTLERVNSDFIGCPRLSSLVNPYLDKTRQLIPELGSLIHESSNE